MKKISFFKYQGTGNDFIMMDNRDGSYDMLTAEQISHLCHRRFGIGADGLILLNADQQYHFRMKYFNSDGRESTMCGNGGRCLVKFASDLDIFESVYRFTAIDGVHEASINTDGTVSLKMNDVESIRTDHGDFILDTGSPHFVHLVNTVDDLDVVKKGREIRYRKEFLPDGINVNFVEQTSYNDRIIVRTYERGVEDETFSCGTGVTAAALVCFHNDNGFNRVEVQTPGGHLSVEFEKQGDSFREIWLTGPAVRVFEGGMIV